MPLKIVCGAASFGDPSRIPNAEFTQPILDVLTANGIKQLDTAYIYQESRAEAILGELKAGSKQEFVIDSKVKSFVPGAHHYESLMETVEEQYKRLDVKQINILYLHAPDRTVPFEESHRAMNELYEKGYFKYFGLSNYTADDVQTFLDNAEKYGWIKPSYYQGLYNLLARKPEQELFPLLKKNNIFFYAYS